MEALETRLEEIVQRSELQVLKFCILSSAFSADLFADSEE
jgi:hypothetical protein